MVRGLLAKPSQFEEIMAERDIEVDHSSMHGWFIKLVPLFGKAFRKRKRSGAKSGRMDETCVKVRCSLSATRLQQEIDSITCVVHTHRFSWNEPMEREIATRLRYLRC